MGETVQQGSLLDRWRVRRGGRLVFAETVRLDGAIARNARRAGGGGGGAALRPCCSCRATRQRSAAMPRAGQSVPAKCGVSAWNGIAVARLCARDGAALRRDLVAVLTRTRHAAAAALAQLRIGA